jgi:hypothetical protein
MYKFDLPIREEPFKELALRSKKKSLRQTPIPTSAIGKSRSTYSRGNDEG